MSSLDTDLQKAEAKLALFLDAEDRVVNGGQSMTIDDGDMRRTVTRADARWIASRIAYWRSEVARLKAAIQAEVYGRKPRRGIYVRPM